MQKDYLMAPRRAENAVNPNGIASSTANFFFYKWSNFRATVAAERFYA